MAFQVYSQRVEQERKWNLQKQKEEKEKQEKEKKEKEDKEEKEGWRI